MERIKHKNFKNHKISYFVLLILLLIIFQFLDTQMWEQKILTWSFFLFLLVLFLNWNLRNLRKTYRTKPALDPLCPPWSARWWGCWCIIIILILTICLREIKTRAFANISKTNKNKYWSGIYLYIRMIYIKYTFMCLYIRKQERYSPGFHMSDYGNDRKILMSNLLY